MARHRIVEVPASNLKKQITEILYKQGYIEKYKFEEAQGKQGIIKIALKYDANGNPVMKSIRRVSTPGKRRYVQVDEIPRVINGLGIAILSTSKGLITNKQAKEANVGGEVLCEVY
jgi:small subunit ribosomal protein S8